MFPVWQAYSSRVWWVSRSYASMSVVSSSRSSMFMRTVPFLVTICLRLNVFCFSRGGSNAVLRSAKGSASCTRASLVFCGGSCRPPEAWRPCWPPSAGEEALCPRPPVPVLCSCPLSPRPRPRPTDSAGAEPPVPWCLPLLPGGVPDSWPAPSRGSSTGMKAMFAVTGRRLAVLSPDSTPRSRIFISAFSIFRAVTFSSTWKATSSGRVSRTWGWPVSCRKRQSARMTCVTSSAPLAGSLAEPRASFTVPSRPCGTIAWEAATKPSLPCRSRRSRGSSFFVFWRSMTAVMK
mmetsp:Transcript_72238/g.174993  ORF Transcript_72238/g.174993 Transcript_72238/m.174993 type:complete len:291 (-) Transcript_72238:799-1671(-)